MSLVLQIVMLYSKFEDEWYNSSDCTHTHISMNKGKSGQVKYRWAGMKEMIHVNTYVDEHTDRQTQRTNKQTGNSKCLVSHLSSQRKWHAIHRTRQDIHTDRQTNTQTYRQTERHTDSHTDIQLTPVKPEKMTCNGIGSPLLLDLQKTLPQ